MAVNHIRHQYVEGPQATSLHTVDVWLPHSAVNASHKGKWVVYIHGGAWRDPETDSTGIKPAIEILTSDPNFQNSFAGFASINYRLSPYPDHPQNPSSPNDCARNAKHPDHMLDVSKGLAFLENRYNISSGYLLVGHSAGATLAFQMREFCEGFSIPIPLGIFGVDGIYALKELTMNYKSIPVYKHLVVNAFGVDETVWTEASPYSSKQPAAWEKVNTVILAHSEEDELLDSTQTRLMCDRAKETPGYQRSLHFLPAKGSHDQIWKQGNELARLIKEALDLL